MSREYPDTFDRAIRPRWDRVAKMAEEGNRFFYRGLPTLCQVCQIPMAFTEPGDPTTSCVRTSEYQRRAVQHLLRRLQVDLRTGAGEVRAGLAAGAPDLPGQLRRSPPFPRCWRGSGLRDGDSGEYLTSADKALWDKWHAAGLVPGPAPWLVSDGGQGALRLLLPVQGPPGALRRRPPGQRHVGEQRDDRAPTCFRVPAAMTWADFKGGVIDPWAAWTRTTTRRPCRRMAARRRAH